MRIPECKEGHSRKSVFRELGMSGGILGVREVEICQTGCRCCQVSSVEEFGMCATMPLDGEMDAPNGRRAPIHGDKSFDNGLTRPIWPGCYRYRDL